MSLSQATNEAASDGLPLLRRNFRSGNQICCREVCFLDLHDGQWRVMTSATCFPTPGPAHDVLNLARVSAETIMPTLEQSFHGPIDASLRPQ